MRNAMIFSTIVGCVFSMIVAIQVGAAEVTGTKDTTTPVPAEPATGMQAPEEMYQNERAEGTLTSEKFVKEAALGGLTEVEASRLALERSKDPQIRAFAERMMKDHGAVNAELKKIAAAKNIVAPDKPDVAHQAQLSSLRLRAADKFDQAYAEMMREDHDKTIALFEQAGNSTALDAQLRSFATKTLSVLHDHQKNAQSLERLTKDVSSSKHD